MRKTIYILAAMGLVLLFYLLEYPPSALAQDPGEEPSDIVAFLQTLTDGYVP